MRYVVYTIMIIVSLQCRDKYEVMLDTPDRGFLVVEGVVSANSSTSIKLSRTTLLSEQGFVPETAATVTIEGEDNSIHTLAQLDSGTYFSQQVPLNNGIAYRLRINTFDKKEYVSDFRPVLTTQEVDSISYQMVDSAVTFYVHSTEDNLSEHYFKWEFEETWRFQSANLAMLKFVVERFPDGTLKVDLECFDPVNCSVNQSIHYCWQNRINSRINIGTTGHLTQSNILLPVLSLPRNAWELSDIYSLLVKQYEISKEAHEFYRKMKKNSESLGSIFDAQPSEIRGNISSLNDPDEPVIGFIEFTSVAEKRIFVDSDSLPGTPYQQDCRIFGGESAKYPYPFDDIPEVRVYVYSELQLRPTILVENIGRPNQFYVAKPECIDCTLRGTNLKPAFWP